MARILIGWELGANRGHAERLRLIAARLLADGHHVALALQQLDSLGLERDTRLSLWQAPVWPRLLVNAAQDHSRPVATLGDILARLGLDRPGCLAAMITGWDAILSAVRPDMVIADYAPALLAAARGRLPTINAGDVFSCPPTDVDVMPNLAGHKTAYDESELLDTVDADLVSVGRVPLPALPALFAADKVLLSSFAEMDPYAAPGRTYCAPSVLPPLADGQGGRGEELFVYGLNRFGVDHPLWQALARVRRPVRLHMPDPTAAHLSLFAKAGIRFEATPVPMTLIAKRSAVTLSYGGHGFLCANLLAVLPQMLVSFDLEKRLYAGRVAALGYGAQCEHFAVEPDALVAQIEALVHDSEMRDRLLAAAPGFHARMAVPLEAEVSAAVRELLG
jgi:rhamnosyltransferase subunit B